MPADLAAGDRPLIVLLHGATASPRIWQPLLPSLTAHHDVMVPTLAGHLDGPPMPVGQANVMDRIVDDMCRQLDEANIDTAHLVGNSLGGWIALELARRGRARSVLALSPAGGWARAVDLQRILMIFRVGIVLRRSRAMPKIAADPRSRRILFRAMAEHAERLSPAQTTGIVEDMIGCDVLPDLIGGARTAGSIKTLSVDCPIRIVWGTKDRTLPFARYGRPIVAAVPGAELEMLADVGHVPMIDDPEATAAAILRFVEGVSQRI
ncbi:alpha/beta hydrolase [Mycobacterium sp. SMC-8]|nr:alpha/beta hydrolase [Mycobacterium sp. SMC-8]